MRILKGTSALLVAAMFALFDVEWSQAATVIRHQSQPISQLCSLKDCFRLNPGHDDVHHR